MCLKATVSVMAGCLTCAGVRYGGERVQQIDVAVTLSVLFAVPIPVNSLGVLVREALVGLSDGDRLKAAYINAVQILRVARNGFADYTHGQSSLVGYCTSS